MAITLPLCFTSPLYRLLYRYNTLFMSNNLRVNDATVLCEVRDETLKTAERIVYNRKTDCTLCGIRWGWRNSCVSRTCYYIVHQVTVQ